MATGMERLASIDRIQDYFVSNDNLQRSAASDKFAHWESSFCSLFFFIMEVMGGNHLFAVWRDASLSIPPGFCLVQNLAHQTQSLRQNPYATGLRALQKKQTEIWYRINDG